jgi:outer membrane immunogenic protein
MMKHLYLLVLLTCSLIGQAQTRKKTSAKKPTAYTKAKTPVKKATAAPAKKSTPRKPVQSTSKVSTPTPPPSTTTRQAASAVSKELGLGNGEHIRKGSKVLDAGIGFSNYGLPIHFSLEKLMKNDLSIGLFTNAQSYSSYGFGFGDSYMIIHGGLKSNYYFNNLLGADDGVWHLAAGLSVGYWRSFFTGDPALGNLSSGRPYLASQIDLRYFLNKHWGILLEGNYGGMNAGIIGVTYR